MAAGAAGGPEVAIPGDRNAAGLARRKEAARIIGAVPGPAARLADVPGAPAVPGADRAALNLAGSAAALLAGNAALIAARRFEDRAASALRDASPVGAFPVGVRAAVVLTDASAAARLLAWAAAILADADLAAFGHPFGALALACALIAEHNVRALGHAPPAAALGAGSGSLALLLLAPLRLPGGSGRGEGGEQAAGQGAEGVPSGAPGRCRADQVVEAIAVHLILRVIEPILAVEAERSG